MCSHRQIDDSPLSPCPITEVSYMQSNDTGVIERAIKVQFATIQTINEPERGKKCRPQMFIAVSLCYIVRDDNVEL
jgi:hypothetical protein